MATNDGDQTYTQAAMHRLHAIEAEQLLQRVRDELMAKVATAGSEDERQWLLA
jgi:hypothetical protein